MFRKFFAIIAVGLISPWSNATVNVVATTPSMGMVVRTVGGDAVVVNELALPDRDIHNLQVKPSMMMQLRRADLLVSVGAELEVGWLPAAMDGAANPKIAVGSNGYFEAASQVKLIDKLQNADRSQGDVHPLGNPHVYFDPVRMGIIAQALAKRLSTLDPSNTNKYTTNANVFQKTLTEKVAVWQKTLKNAKGVLVYHSDADYLLARMNVPLLGFIEPLPGFPPTASHIQKLVAQYAGKQGRIVCMTYQMSPAIKQLANMLHWQATAMPSDVVSGGSQQDYYQFIDRWVNTLAAP